MGRSLKLRKQKARNNALEKEYYTPKATGSLGGKPPMMSFIKKKRSQKRNWMIGCNPKTHIHFINL